MTDVNQFILPPFEPRNPLRVPCAVLAVLFGATLVGGFWMFLERGKARSTARIAAEDLKAGQARIAALEADKAGLETEKEQLETEKAQLETVKSELESVKRELSKNAQAKDDEIAELKGISDKIQDKMKDDIAHGDLHLDQAGSSLRVVVADKVLFDPGEVQVSKRGEGVLARVAEVLAGTPDQEIQVSGHTDRAPINGKLAAQYPTNWELSVARATNVVRFLTEKAKIPAQQLVASGHGEYQPIASNRSSAGRARNRRVEILLTPVLAPTTKSKLTAAGASKTGGKKGAAQKADKKTDQTGKTGKKPKAGGSHAASKGGRPATK
ncbi:MAG: flagellar motor protein MotB [Polyangia bacterium]|jgi:chemotaxis protein MotB